MKTKTILLVLLYFVFLFSFIIYLRYDSKIMQGEWNERSFEEIYVIKFNEVGFTLMDIKEEDFNLDFNITLFEDGRN